MNILTIQPLSVLIAPLMPIDLLTVPTEQLKRILEIRQQLDALRDELNQIEGGGPVPVQSPIPATRGRGGKRYFSPEVRQKMSEAQRRRWAAKKQGEAAPAQEEQPARRKKTLTPKVLAALAKARAARSAKAKAARGE
jgi:hypothetical protein